MCFSSLSRRFNGMLCNRLEPVMHRLYGLYKSDLFGELYDHPDELKVVEIGTGSGPNFRYLPRGLKLTSVEPDISTQANMLSRAEKHSIDVTVVAGSAESIPVPDHSIDYVIATLVFCTVSDPALVLEEVQRILRKGGRLLFVEHVAASKTLQRMNQKLMAPLWKRAFGGCRLRPYTETIFAEAGFSNCQVDKFRITPDVLPISPHIYGWLEK